MRVRVESEFAYSAVIEPDPIGHKMLKKLKHSILQRHFGQS